MPDHADDLVVDELLRNLRRLTRITRIVLGVEHQLDLLAAHHEALLVDFLDRKPCSVLCPRWPPFLWLSHNYW